MISVSTPITESYGPVIPQSVWYAVPPGRMRVSAVAMWVWVPTTAETRPSRYQPERHLFAGHLRVEVDELHLDGGIELAQDLVGLAERAIGGRHVDAALQIDHGAIDAAAACDTYRTPLPGAFGVVGGTQQARLPRQVIEDLALVPDVIAGGQHVEPEREEVLGDRRRNAEAAGRILGIGDRQVDVIRRDDVLQVIGDDAAAGRSEDVADEENVHARAFTLTRTYAVGRALRGALLSSN